MASAEPLCEPTGVLSLARCEAGTDGGDPNRMVAELLVGDGEDERAVDTARVTNQGRPHAAEEGAKGFEFLFCLEGRNSWADCVAARDLRLATHEGEANTFER